MNLMNLEKLIWENQILEKLKIQKEWLPNISNSSSFDFGTVESVPCIKTVKVLCLIGD